MELKVTGWKYENIRGGVRNAGISLDDQPRWTLVQMPNGTGKTTTMTLLRAVMTGADLTPDEVAALRADDSVQDGSFELRLLIDDKPYRVALNLDFATRTASYRTTRSALQSGGSEDGWHLPPTLRKLLTPEFTRLFIFDGEFAKEIRSEGKDRTTKAIRTLYRLDQLDALKSEVAQLVAGRQASAAAITTAKEQKGVNRLKNALTEAQTAMTSLTSKLRKHQTDKAAKEKRRTDVVGRIAERTAQDEKFAARRAKLDVELSAVQARIGDLSRAATVAMRSPAKVSPRLLADLQGLGNRLTTLQLPKTISQEFFHELAHAPNCVCDRPIGPAEKKAILEGAERYLAEDQITIINRMKRSVRESTATGAEYADAAEELKASLRQRRSLDQQVEQLEREQEEAGDEELKALRIERAQLDEDISKIEISIGQLNTTDKQTQILQKLDWRQNIPLCRIEVAACQLKYSTATKTVAFTHAAESISKLVDEISARALDNLRESLRQATNDKLVKLAKSEALTVAKIGSSLELAAQGIAVKGGVSEGQSLAVAYAFITSLLAAAPYRLPFIVDSPAVSLDIRVRREVGEVIPNLFDQMIMFVISSEKDGFADTFYSREDARFITLWRGDDNDTEMRLGIDDFRQFHANEEGDL